MINLLGIFVQRLRASYGTAFSHESSYGIDCYFHMSPRPAISFNSVILKDIVRHRTEIMHEAARFYAQKGAKIAKVIRTIEKFFSNDSN